MLKQGMKHGFAQGAWDDAKEEARKIMIDVAKRSHTIAYSDLVAKINSVKLQAHDQRLFHMLGEISSEEDEAGRGLLTVVVVHKSGDMKPGPGFFELAEALGRDVSDPDACWIEELNRVFKIWRDKRSNHRGV